MNPATPTVSVIMPCYNQGQYFEEAVESVLEQTCQDFEVIVINDGSTDELTVRLLQSYAHPQVQILHTANQGPSLARNTGIQQAQGRYILPLDADDRIAPTYLEKAVAILEQQPEVGIVYSQVEWFGEQTGLCPLPPYQFPEILLGNMIFNTSFYRRDDWQQVGGYNPNMVVGWEDYDFWLSLIELGRAVVQIPEPLYFYRQVANSRSARLTLDRQVTSYVQLFQNHPALYSNHIDVLFREVVMMRQDIHQTHHRLHQAQLELIQTHRELAELHHATRWVPFLKPGWRSRLRAKLKRWRSRFHHSSHPL